MLIRDEQMNSLSRYSTEQFLDRVFKHVLEMFPEGVAEIGESGVHQILSTGVARASEYGFTTEYDVVRFVDLMFVFGMDFDQDASLPALSEILSDESYDSATDKMDDLVEVALEYADKGKE